MKTKKYKPVRKKKAGGILKELLDKIDPASLEKTRQEMLEMIKENEEQIMEELLIFLGIKFVYMNLLKAWENFSNWR